MLTFPFELQMITMIEGFLLTVARCKGVDWLLSEASGDAPFSIKIKTHSGECTSTALKMKKNACH